MRKMTVVFGVLCLALCSMSAQAQMPDPTVSEVTYASYDLSGLKGGEWVEYESTTNMEMKGVPPNPQKSGYKTACVGVEGDTVYIESDQMTAAMWKGTVIMCAVDKKTGNVTKAWWGKPGETGKEIKVQKADGAAPTDNKVETSGTAKVGKETVKAAGADYDCEKIDMDLTTKVSGTESKTKITTWMSEKVAFGGKGGDQKDPYNGKVKWDGKPSGKGGMVKMTMDAAGQGYTMKTETILKGAGSDAKMSLKK